MPSKQTESKQLILLTEAMVGHYRLGSEKVALYLAATLFEGLINSKMNGWNERDIEKNEMYVKIDKIQPPELREDSLFKYQEIFVKYCDFNRVKTFSKSQRVRVDQARRRLHNFRMLRNKLIHNREITNIDKKSNVIEDWIIYLWSELAQDSFKKAYGKRKDKINTDGIIRRTCVIDAIPEHLADYMIRAIDEVEFLEKDSACGHLTGKTVVFSKDFDNLFDLRRKLVFVKNYLTDWLTKNANFLKTDILTTIDTTSAYIWLPIVSKSLADGDRQGVFDCSVSLLATPLDLRIYMDFGGFTRDQRKAYFDFLDGSPEYEALLLELEARGDLEVFDIDWYSAIFNRRKISAWRNQREQDLIEAHNKIEKTSKPEGSPITWNRCLHGYVISKFDLPEDSGIDFAMIETKLLDIIALYQAFDRFKKRTKDKK